MLKKVKELKKEELLVLLSWLKGEQTFTNDKFEYYHLLEETNKKDANLIDVEFDYELLMKDLYPIYEKLNKISLDTLEEKMEESPMFKILPKDIIDDSMRKLDTFLNLYVDMLITSYFEDITLQGKQKTLISEKIDKYILNEEYEKCVELKENLKELE